MKTLFWFIVGCITFAFCLGLAIQDIASGSGIEFRVTVQDALIASMIFFLLARIEAIEERI